MSTFYTVHVTSTARGLYVAISGRLLTFAPARNGADRDAKIRDAVRWMLNRKADDAFTIGATREVGVPGRYVATVWHGTPDVGVGVYSDAHRDFGFSVERV